MKPLKMKISITLDHDVIEEIKMLAEDDDRSFSQYINMLLRSHLRQPEVKKVKKSLLQSRHLTTSCQTKEKTSGGRE